MTINQWPKHQRPRERLIRDGAGALSDAELLAIFLRVGVRGIDAVQLGQHAMKHFGSLQRLFGATLLEFSAINGMGPAKFAQLQAVKQYLRLLFSGRTFESFYVLFLDVKNRLVDVKELFRGTLTHTSVYPREVVKEALARNAASIMLAHNHPSGTEDPSEADLRLTRSLVQALALVDIRILDHFVVAGQHVHSFAEHGQL